MPAHPDDALVVGVDFGTLSGRGSRSGGRRQGARTGVVDFPHAVLERRPPDGEVALPPKWGLQVPSDYIEVLRRAVPDAVRSAGVDPADVVGIATDFTRMHDDLRRPGRHPAL